MKLGNFVCECGFIQSMGRGVLARTLCKEKRNAFNSSIPFLYGTRPIHPCHRFHPHLCCENARCILQPTTSENGKRRFVKHALFSRRSRTHMYSPSNPHDPSCSTTTTLGGEVLTNPVTWPPAWDVLWSELDVFYSRIHRGTFPRSLHNQSASHVTHPMH